MTNHTYADVEVRILDRTQRGYPIELTLNSEQEFSRGYLDPSFLPWRPGNHRGRNLQQEGERLFNWLVSDPTMNRNWEAIRHAAPQRRIRLRIDATAPELHALPWELLREARPDHATIDIAASQATPFSRYLAGTWLPGSPILKRPIKMLVAISAPVDLARHRMAEFDVALEWQNIRMATAGLNIEVTQLPQPCSLENLEAELRNGYHILHFIGHGVYDFRSGHASLIMADAHNFVQSVLDTDFAEMLARQLADSDRLNDDRLRLVFLDSCQTATRDNADAYRGLGPRLVTAGVPAVIAMQEPILITTSQKFSNTFYTQLLEHGIVDRAVNEARSTVLTSQMDGAAIPVLFMRLRSGTLLGQRGRITSNQAAMFWPFLMDNIDSGQCTPFIGPRVHAGLLPEQATIAEKLATKYNYPVEADRHDLVRVAQFIGLADPAVLRREYLRLLQSSLFTSLGIKPTPQQRRQLRNTSLSETVRTLGWSEKVLTMQEAEIHHLLASLELPLYMTTNPDNFMVEALRYQMQQNMAQNEGEMGGEPRQVGPRWEQVDAGTPQHVLLPEPSMEQPVVFHLNGFDGDPDQAAQLVLSEDDFMNHFVRLSRDQESLLPMNILRMLSANSFLFLGYELGDWEFRSILQSLIKPIASTNQAAKLHVGVQLAPEQSHNEEAVRQYLGQYLGQFNIHIYWGTAQQFVNELHTRWQQYLEESAVW